MSETISPRYRPLALIGEGGMGTVYRVHDRLTGQAVALKRVALAAEADEQQLDADRLTLAHEFRTLAGLRHPHIISVLDYGFDAERQPFFTLELLEGAQTLLEHGRGLGIAAQVDLLTQALEALAYLHRRGVLHHDLKPENVLVANQRVRLLDFGLAVVASQQRDDDVFGTLLYLAPEVLEGEPYTEAADLYSLGVIAYELLVGRYPFSVESVARFMQDIRTLAPDLSALAAWPALAALVGQLLAKTPAGRPASAQATIAALHQALGLAAGTSDHTFRESYLQAASFVGRAAELAQLTEALEQARQGRGGGFLIGGESGVGKSRLLDELRTQALVTGTLVLHGQATEGASLPYALWREPLRRLALTSDLSDLEAGVLKPIVPDIAALLERPVASLPPLDPASERMRLQQTIRDLLDRVSGPILLLLEDLQWSAESLALLQQLSRLAPARPLLIVGSYRDDERPDLPSELPKLQLLKLARLDDQGIAELSVAMLGPAGGQPAVLDLLKRESEGNTFFMVEVVRALAEAAGRLSEVGQMTLPRAVVAGSIQQIARRRLRRVPEPWRAPLQLAAVAGRQIDLALLHAAAPALPREKWLLDCTEAAVLEVAEGSWRFAHDKLREQILADLAPDERGALHRQVAEAIEQAYPGDQTRSELLMEHWRGAGDAKRELPYLLTVARTEVSSGAKYRHTLGLVERGIALAEQLGDVPMQLELQAEQGLTYDNLGDYAAAQRCYEQALAQAAPRGLRELERRLYNALARLAWQRGDHQAMVAHASRALTLSRELGDSPGLAHSLNQLGIATENRGELEQARAYYLECVAITRATGNDGRLAAALNNLGNVATDHNDLPGAQAYYAEAYQIDIRRGDRRAMALRLANLGANALDRGAWAEARQHLEQSVQIQRDNELHKSIGLSLNSLAIVELLAGNHTAAERCLAESLEVAHTFNHRLDESEALIWLGQLRRAQGDLAAAHASYTRALETARSVTDITRIGESLLARSFVQPELATARQDLIEVLAIAVQQGSTRLLTEALTGFAWLFMQQGQLTRAAELATQVAAQPNLNQIIVVLYLTPLIADLRAQLGDAAYTAAGARLTGRSLSDLARELLAEAHAARPE